MTLFQYTLVALRTDSVLESISWQQKLDDFGLPFVMSMKEMGIGSAGSRNDHPFRFRPVTEAQGVVRK